MQWLLVRNSSKPDKFYLYTNSDETHQIYITVRQDCLSAALFTGTTIGHARKLVARHDIPRTTSMRNDLTSVKSWGTTELASPMSCLVTGLLNAV